MGVEYTIPSQRLHENSGEARTLCGGYKSGEGRGEGEELRLRRNDVRGWMGVEALEGLLPGHQ